MNQSTDIVCGGLPAHEDSSAQIVKLDLWRETKDENVVLKIQDVHHPLRCDIPTQFHDLSEIAAYVYCADQVVRRTWEKEDVDNFGGRWRRHFRFKIPVRCPSVWNRKDVKDCLVDLLRFLSDDEYDFTFVAAKNPPPFQRYLAFGDNTGTARQPEAVVMFSGGLDSLGGVVEEVLVQRKDVLLVTHMSTQKNNRILRELVGKITSKATTSSVQHLGVRVHKQNYKDSAKEYTQRTRSFLFASIGATIAKMLGINTLRFYENGVVSLNLPICAQVVGGRATRTTHPRVINGFQKLFSLLDNTPFTVENPYLWKTKGEVIQGIVRSGYGDLIDSSISCAHTWQRSNETPHCGTCSQCIDRRIAVVAVGAEEFDRAKQYKIDIFTGERDREDDKIMLATYLERSNRVGQIRTTTNFMVRFPQVVRAIDAIGGNRASVAERLLDLYRRHAGEVTSAVHTMLARHAPDLYKRTLPGDCLLKIVTESRNATTVPAVEVREVTATGASIEMLAKEILDGIDGIKKERISEITEGNSLRQELGEIAGDAGELLGKIIAGFGSDEETARLFMLARSQNPDNPRQPITYEQIGEQFGITKQAVYARLKKMKSDYPQAHRVLEDMRSSIVASKFSELSPRMRRKTGIDKSYGYKEDLRSD